MKAIFPTTNNQPFATLLTPCIGMKPGQTRRHRHLGELNSMTKIVLSTSRKSRQQQWEGKKRKTHFGETNFGQT